MTFNKYTMHKYRLFSLVVVKRSYIVMNLEYWYFVSWLTSVVVFQGKDEHEQIEKSSC